MSIQRSVVKWFDAKKGYGFILHPNGGQDVFVHYSEIISDERFKTLRTGQLVAFEMTETTKGAHARKVVPEEFEPETASSAGVSDLESVRVPLQRPNFYNALRP